MTTNKLYWMGGKETIQEKITTLATAYSLNVKDFTIEVEVNLSDAISEEIKDGDTIEIDFDSLEPNTLSVYKIKPKKGIIRNHFLFILENKP